MKMSIEEKIEADSRSVYVGNVDYGGTAEELEQHFHGCGSINRVTILCNKFDGHPKGFAYIEFGDKESVQTAMAIDESLFRGRQIKVMPKRTNTKRPPSGCQCLSFRGVFLPYSSGYRPMWRSSDGNRRSIPDLILGASLPRLKPNLDTVHTNREIYRSLNINPNTLPRETVKSRLKPNLDIVHAKMEIYRALNININALPRETVKSAPKNMQPPEVPKPTVHKSTNIVKPTENKENLKQSDGNCSRLYLDNFLRKRTTIYSSKHFDNDTYKDDCSGKQTSDSGRQMFSSNSWKRLQMEQLKEEVKQLILDRPDGVRCMELTKLYRAQYHREMNFLRFGHTSIVSFASSLEPQVVMADPTESGDYLLHDARRTPVSRPRAHVPRLTASRLRPTGVPVNPDDALPGIDFTSECYLYPRFHSLETGAPSSSSSPVLRHVNRVPLFPSLDSGSGCAASDTVTEEPCSSSPPPPPTPPPPPRAATPLPLPAPPQMMMSNFMAQSYPSLHSLYFPLYPPYGPQFDHMPPRRAILDPDWVPMEFQPVRQVQYPPCGPPSFSVNPGQHQPPPTQKPRLPYQSPCSPRSPASETKTPPRQRTPSPPYNDCSGGGGNGADAGGRGGGETRRVITGHGDVTLTASECEIFSLLSRVDPNAVHWYMVDVIGRRMKTSTTTTTSTVASTLNPHAAELRQVAATQTEACAGDSLQPTVRLVMESLRPPPGFD